MNANHEELVDLGIVSEDTKSVAPPGGDDGGGGFFGEQGVTAA